MKDNSITIKLTEEEAAELAVAVASYTVLMERLAPEKYDEVRASMSRYYQKMDPDNPFAEESFELMLAFTSIIVGALL